MKNLCKKSIYLIALLSLRSVVIAQPIMVSNGGTYYMCQGSNATFQVSVSGDFIGANTNWEFGSSNTTCGVPSCNIDNYTINGYNTQFNCPGSYIDYYQASIQCNGSNSLSVTVKTNKCVGGADNNVSFTIVPYTTSISGATNYCTSVNPTYTCTTSVPSVTTYSWTPTSFQSITSGQGTSAVTMHSTSSGSGSESVTVTGGCPVGSASNTGSYTVTSSSSAPTSAPTSLTYIEYGTACFYDGQVNGITGAYQYEWGRNSTFTPPLYGSGYSYTNKTADQPFDANTTYTVYVRAINACGDGPANSPAFVKKTGDPSGCKDKPFKPDTNTVISLFKLYPNPVGKELTVEYPQVTDNSTRTISLYDMLGNHIVDKDLPYSDNKITINTSNFSKGMYLYVIHNGENVLERGKILIQH